jgi:DNA repair protein RadC
MSVPIAKIPVEARPRERLQSLGAHALSDGELLALVLRDGRLGHNVLELAHDLLAAHGGLRGLSAARPEELALTVGIGAAKAAALVAAFQLGARAQSVAPDPTPSIGTPQEVAAYARPLFAGARTERLLVVLGDAQNRLQRSLFVADGSLDGVALPVREILNTVLRHDGRSFAVVHNHPSGDCQPSVDDRRTTTLLAEASATVGLRFLGSVIVGAGRWSEARGLY